MARDYSEADRRRSSTGNTRTSGSSSRRHRRQSLGEEQADDERRRDRHRRHHGTEERRGEKERRPSPRRDGGESGRRSEVHHRGKHHHHHHHHRGSRSHLSMSSDEDDCSSVSSVSSLSFQDHYLQKTKKSDGPRNEEDDGSLDSAYIYADDADAKEGEQIEKTDDGDTRRHHRDHRRSRRHRSRRSSHRHHRKDRNDLLPTSKRDHRRRSSITTLDSSHSADDQGEVHVAAADDEQAAAGDGSKDDAAQGITECCHLELELSEVRDQLATALADKIRIERKAEKLESAANFLYRENRELKKKLVDQSIDRTSSAYEVDDHQGKAQAPSSTKLPRQRSVDALNVHTSQETKVKPQKVQRRHSTFTTGADTQRGKLGEQPGSSMSTFQEIPLSVLKAPPPEYEVSSSGGRKNQSRLLSRGHSSRSSVDKNISNSKLPPVADITVESKKKSAAVNRSTSERFRLDDDLPNIGKREENATMSNRAHAMKSAAKRAMSERVFRSASGTDKA